MHDQPGIDAFDGTDGSDTSPPETEGYQGGNSNSSGAEKETTTTASERADGDGQAGLDAFAGTPDEESSDRTGAVPEPGTEGDDAEVVVDQRELDSSIAKDLSRRDGVVTRLETLAVGDYVLSDRVVVERKTVADFLDTLTGDDERSLFAQVKDAARYYARPVVVIEGEGLYSERGVHPNAVRGAIASLAVDFGASVLRTADPEETADLLEVVARREQEADDREVSVHGEKGGKTLTERQEYVVSSVAEVGPVTARALLEHFGSVEAVMTADGATLRAVDGVGEVTAERIREVTGSDYAGSADG